MADELKLLIDFAKTSMPKIKEVWRSKIRRGYDDRMNGKPFSCRRRDHGFYKTGWDRAEKELQDKP